MKPSSLVLPLVLVGTLLAGCGGTTPEDTTTAGDAGSPITTAATTTTDPPPALSSSAAAAVRGCSQAQNVYAATLIVGQTDDEQAKEAVSVSCDEARAALESSASPEVRREITAVFTQHDYDLGKWVIDLFLHGEAVTPTLAGVHPTPELPERWTAEMDDLLASVEHGD